MAQGGQNPPSITDHEVLGNYSINDEGKYTEGDRNRRFLIQPYHQIKDLNTGLDEFMNGPRHGLEPKTLESLQWWMKEHRDCLENKNLLVDIPETTNRR